MQINDDGCGSPGDRSGYRRNALLGARERINVPPEVPVSDRSSVGSWNSSVAFAAVRLEE